MVVEHEMTIAEVRAAKMQLEVLRFEVESEDLLDNLLAQGKKFIAGIEYYNDMFTLASVKDDWAKHKQLVVKINHD